MTEINVQINIRAEENKGKLINNFSKFLRENLTNFDFIVDNEKILGMKNGRDM